MGLRPRITSEDIILLGGIGVTGEYARGGERMNPVVSIDVAKEVSEVQAFLIKESLMERVFQSSIIVKN